MKLAAPEGARPAKPSPRAPARSEGEAGWRARLDLAFEARAGGTALAKAHHVGPLVVQRPFHPEGGACHVYILHPPGGVVAGDELHISAHVGEGAHALVTTPAAGKFYRSTGATARARQDLRVERGVLEWLPQENILFPGARAEVATFLELSPGARCLAWDIACFGLPAQQLAFASGAVRLRFEVQIDAQCVLAENQLLDAEAVSARWGLAGRAALGTLVAYPAGAAELAGARAASLPDVEFGASLVEGALVARALAPRADRLRAAFVAVWRALRPALAGCEAVAPRIWAT